MESSCLLDSFWGFLPALPPGLAEAWVILFLFAVPATLYLAAAGVPFVTVYGLVRASFGRRSLFERAARQQARFGNVLNWLFVAGAGAAVLLRAQPYENLHPVFLWGVLVALGLLTAGTLLWTLVVAAWKPLRKVPVLHGIMAFVSGCCLAAVAVVALVLGRLVLQGATLPEVIDAPTLVNLLVPSLQEPFWAGLALVHVLEGCAAGGMGLWWLTLRRNRDDFGRDYYIFAAKNCGAWGAWGGWLSLAALGCVVWMAVLAGLLPLTNRVIQLFLGAGCVSLLIAAILWTVIARSALPMRRKVGMLFSGLLLFVALACFGVLLIA